MKNTEAVIKKPLIFKHVDDEPREDLIPRVYYKWEQFGLTLTIRAIAFQTALGLQAS